MTRKTMPDYIEERVAKTSRVRTETEAIKTNDLGERATAITVEDTAGSILRFHAREVGFTNLSLITVSNFFRLRGEVQRRGLDMPTFPQLIHLIHSSLRNRKDFESAGYVVRVMHRNPLIGNTARLWGEEGLLVQDNPEIVDGRIVMNETELRNSLQKSKDGVYRSFDGLIRFAPYGFKTECLSLRDIVKNTGIIATIGTKEDALLLTSFKNNYRPRVCFFDPRLRGESSIDVPDAKVYEPESCYNLNFSSQGPSYSALSFGLIRL